MPVSDLLWGSPPAVRQDDLAHSVCLGHFLWYAMAEKLPFFPFYASAWMTDDRVLELSGEQMGAYLWLLCIQWQQGALPYESHRVVAMCPRGIPEVAITYVLLQFFPPDPDTNLRRNPKLAAIREEKLALYRVRVETAKLARKSKQDNGVSSHQVSDQASHEDDGLYVFNLSLTERKRLPATILDAAKRFLIPTKTRAARFAELRGMLDGMTGFPIPEPELARGLSELATSDIPYTANAVRGFARKARQRLQGEAGEREALKGSSSVSRQPDANQSHSGFSEDELE